MTSNKMDASESAQQSARSKQKGQAGTKKAKSNHENYARFIHKTLKAIDGEMGVKKEAMQAMDSLVLDMLDRVGAEAGALSKRRGSSLISVADVETAVRLFFPGELGTHAVHAIRDAHFKVKRSTQ